MQTLQTLIANFNGRTRRETLLGREYLVAPATLIVPGVLSGSKGPLLYPLDEIQNDHTAWNGMPLVAGHPIVNGEHVSARKPNILNQFGIGYVYNASAEGKLAAEAWFDIDLTNSRAPRIMEKLLRDEPVELSTGLFTDNIPVNGAPVHNGKSYVAVARNYKPDHLAVFIDQRGACSNADGCGILVNKEGCGCATCKAGHECPCSTSQEKSMPMADTFESFVENELPTMNGFDSDEQRQAFFGVIAKGDKQSEAKGEGDAASRTSEHANKVNTSEAHTVAAKAHWEASKKHSNSAMKDKHGKAAKEHFDKAKALKKAATANVLVNAVADALAEELYQYPQEVLDEFIVNAINDTPDEEDEEEEEYDDEEEDDALDDEDREVISNGFNEYMDKVKGHLKKKGKYRDEDEEDEEEATDNQHPNPSPTIGGTLSQIGGALSQVGGAIYGAVKSGVKQHRDNFKGPFGLRESPAEKRRRLGAPDDLPSRASVLRAHTSNQHGPVPGISPQHRRAETPGEAERRTGRRRSLLDVVKDHIMGGTNPKKPLPGNTPADPPSRSSMFKKPTENGTPSFANRRGGEFMGEGAPARYVTDAIGAVVRGVAGAVSAAKDRLTGGHVITRTTTRDDRKPAASGSMHGASGTSSTRNQHPNPSPTLEGVIRRIGRAIKGADDKVSDTVRRVERAVGLPSTPLSTERKTNPERKTPTGNSFSTTQGDSMTVNEWINQAPPEGREFLANAARITKQRKEEVVGKLVANLAADKRAAKSEQLMKRDLEDLEGLLDLIPVAPAAPVTNSIHEGSTVDDQLASYLGAATPVVNRAAVANAAGGNSEEDDVSLAVRETDYAEEVKHTSREPVTA